MADDKGRIVMWGLKCNGCNEVFTKPGHEFDNTDEFACPKCGTKDIKVNARQIM